MPAKPLHRSVLRSGTFRFVLLFTAIFAIGSMLVLFTVQRQIHGYADAATESTLNGEARILTSEYRALGLGGLKDAIARHSYGHDPQFRFRLMEADGQLLAGNLPSTVMVQGPGKLNVREPRPDAQGIHIETFRTLGVTLPDGRHLVIGTDTFDVHEMMERLNRFTLACGIGITLFALVGGYFVGSLFVRRLHGVNSAVNQIMAGALHERLPTIGMGPEFDELSHNLNRMLDRIQGLMEGLRQVSTDIAHDMRTPLTRLRQQLEALRGLNEVEAYEAGVSVSLEQIDAILGIFRALLRIGSLEGGVGRTRFTTVDLSEMITRVGAAYEPVVEDSGRVLNQQITPGLLGIGDGELLAQAVTNLIENAMTHTPVGTEIILKLSGDAYGARIVVADNGPGIPTSERAKVLERFYRLDASRSTPGSGLGLALAHAIATLHHTEIGLADNAPGLAIGFTLPPRDDGPSIG